MKNFIFTLAILICIPSLLNADFILKKKNFTAFYDKNKKLYKIEIDSNNDGKPDIVKFLKNGKVYQVSEDKNFDGYFETKVYVKNGKVFKIEKDLNNDKRIDKVIFFKKRKVSEIETDSNFDGKFDTFEFYRNGKLVKKITPDKVIEFLNKDEIKITKQNGDILIYKRNKISKAILDKGHRKIFYKNGKIVKELIDEDRDGFFETVKNNNKIEIFKKNCKYPEKIISPDKILIDKNCNGIYEKEILSKDNFKTILIDRNEDKAFDEKWILTKRNVPLKFMKDKNFDKKFDYFVYYKNGKIEKIEIDSNYDGKIDIWKYYRDGKLIKTERDLNFDGKIDIEE